MHVLQLTRLMHGVMESFRDLELRRYPQQGRSGHADGMPLVWMSHRLDSPCQAGLRADLMRDMTTLSANTVTEISTMAALTETPEPRWDVLTRRHPGFRSSARSRRRSVR